MAIVFPGANETITSLTELWGTMLLWAVISSLLIYLLVGLFWAALFRVGQKRRQNILFPFLFLLLGCWKVLSADALVCAFIAGIYVTLDEGMDGVVSLGWGVGVSVVTILVDILIACVPVYPVL